LEIQHSLQTGALVLKPQRQPSCLSCFSLRCLM
jgi:hypothetical protein